MTTAWWRIAVLYAAGVSAAAQFGLVPPLVPALQRDLGLSLTAIGFCISGVTLAAALFGLCTGVWCERIGHGRALVLGILVMGLAAALCAAAGGAQALLAARALAGIGYLLVVIAAPSLMIAVSEPRHRALALSLWGTFVPTGIALAGIATAELADHARWRLAFALDGVVLAAVLLLALGTVQRVDAPPRPVRWTPLTMVRPALPLAVAFFCFALLFLALAGLLPAYLVDGRGMTPAAAARSIALTTAFGIAGSLATAWLIRAGIAPSRLVAGGLLGSSVLAALCLAVAPPVPLAISGLALSFAVGGLIPAAAFASVPRLAADPRAVGPINGLLAQAGSLGSLAGPPALALWVETTSWSWTPVLLLAVAVTGAVALRPASRPPATSSCRGPAAGGHANRRDRGSSSRCP